MTMITTSAKSTVLQNDDLMWVVVSFLTGFQTSKACSEQQFPVIDPRSHTAPLLPLLLTFPSLRRTRREQLGITLVSMKSQFVTSMSMVEWAISMGCNFATMRRTKTMCTMAAKGGQVNLLEWLRSLEPSRYSSWHGLEHGYDDCCTAAAGGGHLDALKWLRSQQPPCPWSDRTCTAAAGGGHLDVLKWFRSQHQPCPWN